MQRKHFGRLLIILVLAVSSAFGNPRNLYAYADRIPGVVDKTGKTYGVWAPDKGAVLFYGRDMSDSGRASFFIKLHLSKDAIEFYKKNKKWAALELQIVLEKTPHKTLSFGKFPRIKSKSIESDPSNLRVIRDTIIFDDTCNRAVIVLKPYNVSPDGWMEVKFSLKKNDFLPAFNFESVWVPRDNFGYGEKYTFHFFASLVGDPLKMDYVSFSKYVGEGYFGTHFLGFTTRFHGGLDVSEEAKYPVYYGPFGAIYREIRNSVGLDKSPKAFKYFPVAEGQRIISEDDTDNFFTINNNSDGIGLCWNTPRKEEGDTVKCSAYDYERVLGTVEAIANPSNGYGYYYHNSGGRISEVP